MSATAPQLDGGGGADAAAGARDQGDQARQRAHQRSVSRLSCRSALSTMSGSAIGYSPVKQASQ